MRGGLSDDGNSTSAENEENRNKDKEETSRA